MNNQAIRNRLLNIESWAKGLMEECRKTRKLLEEDVSTPAKGNNNDEVVAKVVTKFRAGLLKKSNKKRASC